MSIDRGFDDSDPIRHEERRRAPAGRLGLGTLACPHCDAPVAIGESSLSPADRIGCPYCLHGGAVREFLSLDPPVRPTRVAVRVSLRR